MSPLAIPWLMIKLSSLSLVAAKTVINGRFDNDEMLSLFILKIRRLIIIVKSNAFDAMKSISFGTISVIFKDLVLVLFLSTDVFNQKKAINQNERDENDFAFPRY
jgi:hypothetical protein